jgi:hypothetical protein
LVNDKRVERIWRREGLKVPARQPVRSRLWLADGSCIRLRAECPNHVWSYDFVEERAHEDFILHFCVRRYLCGPAQQYHITDFSKGAMLVE